MKAITLPATGISPVVPFDKNDKILELNFTGSKQEITDEILNDTGLFSQYINDKLLTAGARYGIGGWNEHRTIYSRSSVFDAGNEPRRLHLGIDIWGGAGTPVMAPLDAVVHSFAFNKAYGDYGATIILQHTYEGQAFYTLYGHLSLSSISIINEGDAVKAGQEFAAFGIPSENGQWPPHLHFQIILDIGDRKGDYPGVCRFSEKEQYLRNSPDADILLNMMQLAIVE